MGWIIAIVFTCLWHRSELRRLRMTSLACCLLIDLRYYVHGPASKRLLKKYDGDRVYEIVQEEADRT